MKRFEETDSGKSEKAAMSEEKQMKKNKKLHCLPSFSPPFLSSMTLFLLQSSSSSSLPTMMIMIIIIIVVEPTNAAAVAACPSPINFVASPGRFVLLLSVCCGRPRR